MQKFWGQNKIKSVQEKQFFLYTLSKFIRITINYNRENFTYISFPPTADPLSSSIAVFALSSVSNCTKPNPLLLPSSETATLQDKIFPNFWNISSSFVLSIVSFRFCSKIPNHFHIGIKAIRGKKTIKISK